MRKIEISRYGHRIILKKNTTKIVNSYDLSKENIKNIAESIHYTRRCLNYNVKRDTDSYIREILAHIRLYKLHLFRSHTKDTDLEENITRTKEFIYRIVGWY